jgi:hypothetical protein
MVCKFHLTLLSGRPDVQVSHHVTVLYGALSNLTLPRRINVELKTWNGIPRRFWWCYSGNAAAELRPSISLLLKRRRTRWHSGRAKERHSGSSVSSFVPLCTTHKQITSTFISLHFYLLMCIVKVKLSLYRPWRPLGLRVWRSHIFRHWLTDGDKVVSPTRRPLFTPRKIPGTHFY